MPAPIRYPPPLLPGARIAVTAPSSGVEAPLHARLDLVLAHLRASGFVIEEGNCLREQRASASAGADERAADLTRLLLRNDVDAVIPPWGGELAIELLDRLDWVALQRATPKWLLGYSDTSTLLVAISLRLGWASAHGPCLMDLAPGQPDPLTRGALSCLATPSGSRFTQAQSSAWQRQWTDFAKVPDTTYALTEATHWFALDGRRELTMSGRLIGGCIDTLTHTAGTVHGDVCAFIECCGSDGVLLYLENAELSPVALVRALHRLRWAGWLDGLAGLLIGRSAGPAPSGPAQLGYLDGLRNTLGGLRCPVLVDVDIGHRPPQFVLVNGALAEVRWSEAAGGSIEQRLD
jgi:muramoyltetrapeptide carboxypeptidase